MQGKKRFPRELLELKQWCIWKFETRGGKKTKIPYSIDNRMAKSNDESTWADYKSAQDALMKHGADGLGFFFKYPYMGIDIDDVPEEIERLRHGDYSDNVVFEMYEGLKSYAEVSPSGNGIHIILKGKVPGERRRKDNIEMYDSGRFFTMTGNTLGKYNEINTSNKKAIKRIYDKYINPQNVVHFDRVGNREHGVSHDLTESEIIARIMESKQSETFRSFMNDDWQENYESQSEADLAFANILAFWCARDFTKMDSLFRQSSLMRSKWDEKRGKTTYGEATLYKAINDAQNVFTPSSKREPPKYDINFGTGEINKPKDYPARSWDDTGNADRFMDRFGDLIRYSFIDSKFYVYEQGVWQKDDMGQVRQLIDAMIEDMRNEKISISEDMDPDEVEEVEKAWRKFISNTRNNSKKRAIVDELKHRV